jgi:hypothetical protein
LPDNTKKLGMLFLVKYLIQAPIHENNFSPKPKTKNIANLEEKKP